MALSLFHWKSFAVTDQSMKTVKPSTLNDLHYMVLNTNAGLMAATLKLSVITISLLIILYHFTGDSH